MARLSVSNDNATITRVTSRTRAGEDKVPLVALTIEIPEAALDDDEIGRLFRARGRPLTLTVEDPQMELPLAAPSNGRRAPLGDARRGDES